MASPSQDVNGYLEELKKYVMDAGDDGVQLSLSDYLLMREELGIYVSEENADGDLRIRRAGRPRSLEPVVFWPRRYRVKWQVEGSDGKGGQFVFIYTTARPEGAFAPTE